MTAAWELTQPQLAGQFEVTVYQLGWRLGGKGASGRGVGGRIEEHGLHLWMGHYDNAFRLMRQCYRELGREPAIHPIATWRDAFVPDRYVGLADPAGDGQWHRFMACFPPQKGTPGDPRPTGLGMTVTDYLRRTVGLVYELIRSAADVDALREQARATAENVENRGEADPELENGARAGNIASVITGITRIVSYGQIITLTALHHAVGLLQIAIEMMPRLPQDLLLRFLDILSESFRRLLAPLLEGDTMSRYTWEIIDIVLAQLRGSVRFQLATDPRGFDAINDYELREWLRLNGASEQGLDSAFVRGLYDLAFAYEDGDPAKPGIAAGQGLRGGLRMFFNYRESLFWKMQGGMGDIVFAPLYEVLRTRGVRFEFFHRLENVGLDGWDDPQDSPHVSDLTFAVQARVQADEYQPLVDFDGTPCWLSEPDWSQLENGDALEAEHRQFESFWDRRRVDTRTLKVSRDFDFVVLGVSIGEIPHVCTELLERDERWRKMVESVKTVPTQALQLWLNEDLEQLGWHEEPPNLSAFVEPFDTWADMSHLVPVENWPGTHPKTIAYFCNVLPCETLNAHEAEDPQYPERYAETVRNNAVQFLDNDIKALWPAAISQSGRFRWDLLADPLERQGRESIYQGEERLRSQFWTANVNPTDRYVQSLPGTLQHRISPLDYSYDNLTIAGDWTDCGFNMGCVEAAVMSGRLASHAIAQYPPLEDIDGYDHP